MATRANDSDGGGSMTPSEQSDGEDRSEHDSDYETDDGKEEEDDSRDKNLNIIWTGYGKKIPVILFSASSILNKHTNFKAVGDQYHLAFKFGGAECKIIRNILMAHGFQEVHQNCSDFNVAWTSCHLKPFILRSLTEFQKINHFPRSSELTRKDRLYKNIQRMQQIKGIKHFDFVPQTYVMPNEYQEFCSQFLKDRGPWIVKPVASSRGRGVFLVNHPDQVPFDENVIVSQYLQNPLVIDGFKFDIRLYVAVTSYDPLVIYLYEEGLTRFATVKYERSTKHLRNQCMHLTNYSVNKKSNDYVKNDDPDVEDYGNKWSMGAMLRYLRSIGKDTAALMMRIEDVVIKTLLSVELSIATACKMFMPYRGNCFELYGFDILVDDCLKPWVLEVNLSPSLACDSPLDLKIKGNMLCDLFSLTGIVCHDPMVRSLQHQSRRNQDFIRMTGRAKTALSRTGITRPKARPQSATHSSRAGSMTQGKTGMTGLNSEEIKIIRRVKEEEQRKGGWIRIFPSPDTWDVHGPFLQFSTTHNLMLHQRLYPERHKQMSLKSYGGSSISAAARSRNGYLQVMGTGQRLETEKSIESYTLAMLRSRQYERKLGSRSKHRRKEYRQKDSQGQLVQGMPDDLEDGENQSDEDYEQIDSRGRPCEAEDRKPRRKELSKSSTTTSDSGQTQPPPPPQARLSKSVTEKRVQEVKVEVPHLVPPVLTQPTSAPPMNYDMVEVLMEGATLSKVQVRSAFTMYLQRVRERLLSEGSPVETEETDTLNEQMDLVLRFLKRAAVNLQQTFRVVVPSRKLSLGDRRHILAKQLADFVHIYTRETEQLKHLLKCPERTGSQNHASQKADSETSIDEDRFNHFISVASESDLEQMLTTYTKLNKSSTIFLGSSISASSSPAKPPHNPLPPPQAQRLEMMQHRRREAGEGDCQGPGRPGTTLRENSASCVDNHGAGSTGSLSRPASASSSTSAAVAAVSICSQRLGRPLSASNYKSPALKLISRPSSTKPSPFSTSEPVVDTYNEEAIREALKRLTVKQQARQYSSGNSSIGLKPTPSSQPAKEEHHRRGSLSPVDEQTDHSTTHPGTLHCVGSRPGSGASRSHQGSRGDSNRDRGKFTVSHPVSLTQSEVYVSKRIQAQDDPQAQVSSKRAQAQGDPQAQVSSKRAQAQGDPQAQVSSKRAQAQGDPEAKVDYVSLSSTSSRPGSRAQSEDQVSLPECAPSQPGSLWSSHPKPSYGLSCSDQDGAEKPLQRKGPGRENAHQGKPPLPGKGDQGGRLGSSASTSSASCSTDALGEHLLSKHASLAVIGRPPSQSLWGGVDLVPERCSQTTQREPPWVKHPEQHGHMLMEANKAKHHAMVAQAHAAQRGSGSRRPLREASKPPHATETEASIAQGTPTFNPKPPTQPASSRTPQSVPHRMTRSMDAMCRLSSVENLFLGVGFQNSLKCHLYTQHRRKTETNADEE